MEWRSAKVYREGVDARVIVPNIGTLPYLGLKAAGPQWTTYEPLNEDPALFRKFASLEASESAFLDFAQRFGLLGVPTAVESRANARVPEMAESFFWWERERQFLYRAMVLWDLVQGKRWKTLSQLVVIELSRAVLRPEPIGSSLVNMTAFGEHIIASPTRSSDVWHEAMAIRNPNARTERLALCWIAETINTRLASPDGLQTTLVLDRDEKRLVLQAMPPNLRVGLWLQFAQSIEQQRRFQQCASCLVWMAVRLGRGRRARFCSDNCRLRSWRQQPD